LQFCSFAEQCLNTIYALADRPDVLATSIVKRWASALYPRALTGDYSEENVNPRELSVFFFLIGHIALKQVVHAEVVQTDLRSLRHAAELAMEKERTDLDESEDLEDLEAIEKELGVHEAVAEQEQEQVQQSTERELVSFRNLLGRFVPLLHAVLNDFNGLFGGTGSTGPGHRGKHTRTILRESAVLALSKICCVDEQFCEVDNLQLLFSVLAYSESKAGSEAEYAFESSVRSNVVIALGDLSFRFPNLVEPWQDQVKCSRFLRCFVADSHFSQKNKKTKQKKRCTQHCSMRTRVCARMLFSS
jgi:condensin complex subunit 1